jgi:bifunctional non-homologous end joining protein LigD
LHATFPLKWEELDGLDSAAQWNIGTLAQRFAAMKKEAWSLPGKSQATTAAMRKKPGIEG